MSAAVESPQSIQEEMDGIKHKLNQVIYNNRYLKKQVTDLALENDRLLESIYNIEVNISNIDQYSRRSNVEICNVPEKIAQNNLEEYVIKFLDSIGIKIQSYDLVAVHRVGTFRQGKIRNVIVRFLNRKDAYRCLRVSKKIKRTNTPEYKRFFIIENLCPTNKKIFNFLYKLKKMDKINNVWSYNGSVFYQMNEDDEFSERADHIDDLDYLYDELSLCDSAFSDNEF